MGGTTISVGLAEFDPDTSADAAELRERADRALSRAKRRGRGEVAVFAATPVGTRAAAFAAPHPRG